MTKLVPITNFAKAGLNTDLMPWDLPGDFLTDMKNVRITRGKLIPFGGYSEWVDMPIDFNAGYLMHVGSTSGTFWLIPGEDKVYAYDSATFHDITSVASNNYQTILTPGEDLLIGILSTGLSNQVEYYWRFFLGIVLRLGRVLMSSVA
jgi:hypothetical protein